MDTIRLHGIAQFITILPFEFGFAPTDSVVVGYFDDSLLALIRLDQCDLETAGVEVTADLIRRHANQVSAEHLVIIDYQPNATSGVCEALTNFLTAGGVKVEHLLHVRANAWWASRCTRGCCDGMLHSVPAATEVPAVADFVVRGVAPANDRRTAVAGLREQNPSAMSEVERVRRRMTCDPALSLEEWDELCRGSAMVPQHERAELIAAVLCGLDDPRTRDEYLAVIVPELVGLAVTESAVAASESASATAHSLRLCLPAIPQRYRGLWLAFIALTRWRGGDLTGAHIAAAEAVRCDARSPLVAVVGQLLSVRMRYTDFVASHHDCPTVSRDPFTAPAHPGADADDLSA